MLGNGFQGIQPPAPRGSIQSDTPEHLSSIEDGERPEEIYGFLVKVGRDKLPEDLRQQSVLIVQ